MIADFGVAVVMVLRKEWSSTLAPGPKESVVMSVTKAQRLGAGDGCLASALGVDMAGKEEGEARLLFSTRRMGNGERAWF
jgi:hypothetical protein